MYKYQIVSKYSMSIRPSPNTANSPIGKLPAGAKGLGDGLQVDANGNRWLYIVNGGTTKGWVAINYNGKEYCSLTELQSNSPLPTESAETTFPKSFTLIDDSGKRAEYVFVKVIN